MTTPAPAPREWVIAWVRAAHDRATAKISAARDLDQQWAEARMLADLYAELARDTSSMRARIARQIAQRDSLSLAGLANRLTGISRQRLHRLMADDERTTTDA